MISFSFSGFKCTTKRPSTTILHQEPEILHIKRPRPGSSFYAQLSDNDHYDDILPQTSQPSESLNQSGKKSSQQQQSSHWMDQIIEECVSLGVKCQAAMRLINKFILATKKEW